MLSNNLKAVRFSVTTLVASGLISRTAFWNTLGFTALTLSMRPMPIFHFDIADGVRLEDPVGLD
jgi:hypothetical protein